MYETNDLQPVVGHFAGIDSIHRTKLIRKITDRVSVIDLDSLQHTIYNSSQVTSLKKKWEETTAEINRHQKEKKVVGSKNAIIKKIEKLRQKRDEVRDEIYDHWKDMMSNEIERLHREAQLPVLFFGFNIYPKDYRVSVVLPSLPSNGCWFFDTVPQSYASNQIKYHLDTYRDRIIKGNFPTNLLNLDYLAGKYNKFTSYYLRKKYSPLSKKNWSEAIQGRLNEIEESKRLPEVVYYASKTNHGDTILPKKGKPLVFYLTSQEALDSIRESVTPMSVIHLYRIPSSQCQVINGACQSIQTVFPLDSESVLLTAPTESSS